MKGSALKDKMKYHNLTQATGDRVCYFRSTDLEQKNWKRLLWSFPDEMLYMLAKGEDIVIVDKSIKPRNKIERIFAPVMNDLLNWMYFQEGPKNKNLSNHYALAKQELEDPALRTKFMYWKKYIRRVSIKGETIRVPREEGLALGLEQRV